jgi:TolA-binding protein
MMRSIPILLLVTVLLPGGAFGAASKEMQEMQRDIAQLQDQIRSLQSSQDQKFAAIQAILQQATDAANKANTAVAVLSSTVNQTLERELTNKMAPIAGLAAKADNTNNDVSELRSSVTEIVTTMNKLLTKMNDMNEAIKVLQAPAAPPPGSSQTGPAGLAPSSSAPIPAQPLYEAASKDYSSGRFDMAISEYSDFIKFYPDNPNAAAAQLAIGEAHQSQGKFELAAQDFDSVIERYPANDQVTPDAYFMKAGALKAAGRKTEAIATYRAVIAKYPHKDVAEQSKAQLRAMGVTLTTPAAPATKRRPK